MTGLEQIQKCLSTYLDVDTTIDETGGVLHGNNDRITVLVTTPTDDTNGRWLIRMSPTVSFDRWNNSTAIEEEFAEAKYLCYYIECCELTIYIQLYEALMREFEELREANESLREYSRKSWEEADDYCE